jgi:hypothetical protein
MIRKLLSIIGVGLLTAVVGADSSKSLLPQQRAELYKKNRSVIERLVEKTVESSKTPNDYVKQTDTYYKVLYDLGNEIKKARDNREDERVQELVEHLTTLVDKGLMPTLMQARTQVEGGTGEEDFQKVRKDLVAQLTALADVMEDRPGVKQSLEQAKARLGEISGPGKK